MIEVLLGEPILIVMLLLLTLVSITVLAGTAAPPPPPPQGIVIQAPPPPAAVPVAAVGGCLGTLIALALLAMGIGICCLHFLGEEEGGRDEGHIIPASR